MTAKKLLEDIFTYETIPFLIEVEQREMYINPEKGMIRGVNIKGHPAGMGHTPKEWTICECRVATLRPDYPYTIENEWPENVDKHFKIYEPLEWPEKHKGLIFTRYETVSREPERDPQEMAEDAVSKMKNAYKNRDCVASLEFNPV